MDSRPAHYLYKKITYSVSKMNDAEMLISSIMENEVGMSKLDNKWAVTK